jgi:hypothetical protein
MLLNTNTDVKRSGMILLIVVAFLSMFLVVGTTYLLVADSIRRTSDFDLNATDKRSDYALMTDIDPRYMFNFALGQILYDVTDPVLAGGKVVTTNSALRGHSLARSIYGGYNDLGGNDRPFQGMGKDKDAEYNGSPNYMVVGLTNGVGVRDPEKGTRTTVSPNSTKISSWNPPYTYPDQNHLYLGSYTLKSDGTTPPIIKPSFYFDNATTLRASLPQVPPEVDGFDVKNLEGYPGGNDSIWIDAGFPVMTTPDGRKYKALIAPLILDLDGRINLNVAGNLMQRDTTTPNFTADHASNQGWGRWEINPKKLIDPSSGLVPYPGQPQYSPFSPANEFLNLLSYDADQSGMNRQAPAATRAFSSITNWKTYGRLFEAKYLPVNGTPPPVTNFSTTIPHSYAQVDFNGAGDYQAMGAWGPTTKPTFVDPTTNQPYPNGFPSFGNGKGFGNGQASENFLDPADPLTKNYHARNYNPYRTQSSADGISTVFPVSETASILRWQGKGEPFSKSQLAQLLPKSLGLDMPYESASSTSTSINKNDAIFRQRIRNMVTTLSADLDRPAMVPIEIDLNYKVGGDNSPNDYPKSTNPDITSPSPNQTSPALKINLNRYLSPFPDFVPNTYCYPDINTNIPNIVPPKTYKKAIEDAKFDRESLALELFTCLKNVAAFDGVDAATNRWFAQLAANIVDFIDQDDFNTCFKFEGNNYVFGVEMPRLVINEVYVQVKNRSTDNFMVPDNKFDVKEDYDVNTYVELKNPLPTDGIYDNKPGNHKAVLQVSDMGNPKSIYKLVMNKRGKFWTPPAGETAQKSLAEKMAEDFNYYGSYDLVPGNPNSIVLEVKPVQGWGNPIPRAVEPGSSLVVSSKLDFKLDSADGVADPAKPLFNSDFESADLNLFLPKTEDISTLKGDDVPTFILQRLAIPGLPEQNNLNQVDFNPFITVDTFVTTTAQNPFIDRREVDKMYNTYTKNVPKNSGFVKNADADNIKSVQRKAPYLDSVSGSDPNQGLSQFFYNGKNLNFQKQTIGNDNNNNQKPWLTFLDRKLINPLELIHVPCCKPHELTQMANRWNDPVGQAYRYAHNWPWFDENTRLYRFLETVGVSPLQAGEAMHGRALGKVNVNTMHGEEVFQAVADAKNTAGPNNFSSTDVTTAFKKLTGDGSTDQRPILSFGQANYTAGMVKYGLNRSLMGYSVGDKPNENILDVASFGADNTNGNIVATYFRKELLTKIGNSVTTKSNVFAVWITTGYFEVFDDTVQPPSLGAEIGKADGINIRHRMFAIVDRTNMVTGIGASSVNVPGNGFVAIVGNLTHPNGRTTAIQNGMILTFDPNTDTEETVQVANGGATFTKPHALNCTVINRGNPGPWVGYDRNKDRDVVPFAEIIE